MGRVLLGLGKPGRIALDSLRLAQLMCSRLCHDLITPVGAISTGLEIMEESDGEIDDELMSLTSTSAKNAAQRLIYYRAAFGFSSVASLDSFEKIRNVLDMYLRTCKLNVEWECSQTIDQATLKDNVRIIINLAGILAESAPYGGQFKISLKQIDDVLNCSYTLTGDLVGLKSDTKRAMQGLLDEQDVTPHTVQSYLTKLFVDMKNGDLTILADSKEKIEVSYQSGQMLSNLTGSLF